MSRKRRRKNADAFLSCLKVAYSANELKGYDFSGMGFEDFISCKNHVKQCAERLRKNMCDGETLSLLKHSFILFKSLYIRFSKTERNRRNKLPERMAELNELKPDEIIKLITESETAQYNAFFEKHTGLMRVNPKTLLKKDRERIRSESLTDIYRSRYVAMNVKLKIEESLLENPKELYPAARGIKRRFIIHSGTTNTGKTYNALEALKRAETGVYLGPLRLLAMEIQETLLMADVMCSMRTGEEENIIPFATHISSTVEMIDLYAIYDTAVIDECQMIGDMHRGCAWTRAILGVCAREVHLCTAPEAVELLTSIIDDCGDEYEIIRYDRRTPIQYDDSLKTHAIIRWTDDAGKLKKPPVEDRMAGIKLSELRYGDAIIAFSRDDVMDIAKLLRRRGINASVIYGALPYKTRKEQLKRFYTRQTEIVVATDAIGMGLNLPIRRIIFTSAYKFDGERYRLLTPPEIKQIAGRAGRIGMYDEGFVFSVTEAEYIYSALESDIAPIKKAYIDFDTEFIDIESGLREILQAWETADMPFDMYEKINVSRTLRLMRHLEKMCEREGYVCSKETEYMLTTIKFADSDGNVLKAWLDYAREYLGGKIELSYPKMRFWDMEYLETAYKKVDLYYAFCRAVGYEPDMGWINDTKEYIVSEMNYRLKK